MRLIRAGKVVFTDETAPEQEPEELKLTRAEQRSLDQYRIAVARSDREKARIQEDTDRRVTFKHTEPKHIYSPAGRVLNQFEAPKYREKPYRQGHWAPYERR